MKAVAFALVGLLAGAGLAMAQPAPVWPREFPPRPLQPRAVTFPPFEIKKLPNGLTVVLVSQNEQPAQPNTNNLCKE